MFINQQGVQAATIDIYGWSFNSIRYGDMLASRKKPRIPETHKNQGHNFREVFIQKINQHMGFQPDPLGWFSTFQLLMFKYGWWYIMMIWWLQDISTIFEKKTSTWTVWERSTSHGCSFSSHSTQPATQLRAETRWTSGWAWSAPDSITCYIMSYIIMAYQNKRNIIYASAIL